MSAIANVEPRLIGWDDEGGTLWDTDPPPLTFTIPGNPIPKERARTVKARRGRMKGKTISFTPTRTATYEGLVSFHALTAVTAWQVKHGSAWPPDARYHLTLTVVRDSHRPCDLSNILKAVEDGAQSKFTKVRKRKVRTLALLWDDDAQIDGLSVERGPVNAASPSVSVTVRRLPVQSRSAKAGGAGR